MYVFKEVAVRSQDAACILRELDEVLVQLIGHNGQRHVCWDDFEQPRSTFIVGYEEGEAVGCIGIRCLNEQTAELKRVYARKHHPGLACGLMDFAEDWARRQGYVRTVLECRDNNPHAIAFYKRNGYTVCRNYPPYEEEADAVCLEKSL